MKVYPYHEVPFPIDGDQIVLRIARMTLEQHDWFMERYRKFGEKTIDRFAYRTPDEQQKNDQDGYVIPWEAICARRLQEMTPDKRAEYEAARDQDERDAKAFISEAFATYLTVKSGLIEETTDGSERSVTSGTDFLRIFGARADVLIPALNAIWMQNTLTEEQKKTLSSARASSPSSNGRAGSGPRPETTVEPVETAVSAPTVAVMEMREDRSGSMAAVRERSR